jgi:Rod binding domain-containing protein
MNDIQALNNLHASPVAGSPALDPRAVKAAKDFEAVLLHQLMETMQATIPESGLFEDGTSKQVQSIFWNFLSQDAADKGGMGLWKDLYRQLECSTGVPPVSRMDVSSMQRVLGSDALESVRAAAVSRYETPASLGHGQDARAIHGRDARATAEVLT